VARRYAPLLCAIWDDPDFQNLSERAQRCYVLLISQRKLTMVGVLPFTPRSWSRGCKDTNTQDILDAIADLTRSRFVIVDDNTEELLVRTMVKHDPPRGPKSITAMWRSLEMVESPALRAAIVREIPPAVLADERSTPPAWVSDAPSDAPSDDESALVDSPDDELIHRNASPQVDAPSDGARVCARAATEPPATCPPATVPTSHLSTTPVSGELFEHIVGRIVFNREQRTPPRNPEAWRTKVRTSVVNEHSDRICSLIARYPDAPHDVIAAAVEGDTQSLRYYQATDESAFCPTCREKLGRCLCD